MFGGIHWELLKQLINNIFIILIGRLLLGILSGQISLLCQLFQKKKKKKNKLQEVVAAVENLIKTDHGLEEEK